ncbi:MAG: DUF1015 domain-containing protein [Actinobacteria bacterium]|nr:DUF1015 domain-containing protein [Actinomycetota bacterium]
MVDFRPFRTLRPVPHLAAEIASLPYDVLDTDEARAEVARHHLSFLHVEKPEVDLPPGTDPHDPRVYETARLNLDRYVNEGLMTQDPVPTFSVYRQVMDGRAQVGVVGLASVDEYLADVIRKHELTRAEKEEDRVRHMDACDAHPSPVFLTHRHSPAVDAVTSRVMAAAPFHDFTSSDGVGHTLWRVDEAEDIEALRAAFGEMGNLYVADGHHRTASAARIGLLRREQNPEWTGEEEFNHFMAVAFPDAQLRILDYNRVVADLAGSDIEEFLDRVGEGFEVEAATGDPAPTAPHEFGMYLAGSWYRLRARTGTWNPADPVGSLDVSILQDRLLSPVLGIGDPRRDERIDFVGGIRGLGELEEWVDGGDAAVAFALFPTSMDELLAVADAGMIMPPKSTWFEPKLRSGLFVHLLH